MTPPFPSVPCAGTSRTDHRHGIWHSARTPRGGRVHQTLAREVVLQEAALVREEAAPVREEAASVREEAALVREGAALVREVASLTWLAGEQLGLSTQVDWVGDGSLTRDFFSGIV